jgi:phosphoglycolate phosphatase
VIFCIGHVFLIWMGHWRNTLESIAYFSNRALEQCGYPTIPVQDYKTIVGDGADMQVRRMLDRTAGKGAWSEEDFQKVRTVYGGLYASDPTYLLKNYGGMPQTVRELKTAGIKTAVLSNKPHEWVTAIIAHLFPEGSFDACYGQRPQVPRKPAPDGALLIAEEIGVAPKAVPLHRRHEHRHENRRRSRHGYHRRAVGISDPCGAYGKSRALSCGDAGAGCRNCHRRRARHEVTDEQGVPSDSLRAEARPANHQNGDCRYGLRCNLQHAEA